MAQTSLFPCEPLLLTALLSFQRVGLWSRGSNETEGGTGSRCTCDAFLPSSTFPVKDLVEVEEAAVEISRKLELEMGKVD